MSPHNCYGVSSKDNIVALCKCVSPEMYEKLMRYAKAEFIKEIQAFAGDYHHHIDGRDVVIVEQLLDFLKPIEGVNQDGSGNE